jgi:hypothetical protein
VTNAEVDAIKVQDTPMGLQRALTPLLKLLCQGVVETTDTTGTGGNSYERLSHFSHFLGADSSHKHLGQSLGYLWFIALVAVKNLGMELPFSISGDFQVFDGTQTPVAKSRMSRPITIAFALGSGLSPGGSQELLEFFTHDLFDHHAYGIACQGAQMVMKALLRW